MTNKPILEIRGLTVSFSQGAQKIEAVKNLSLRVDERSFTCLVGESGSGKTVTALSVTRLLPQAMVQGDILWRQNSKLVDLSKLSEKELANFRGREISYVFQDPGTSLNPLIRIGDQIRETFLAHFPAFAKEAKKETMTQLRAVQLKDPERVYRAYPHQLSGGMKQRAMIAMALVAKPKLLIADEPTTALDVTVESEILKLLETLNKARGLSILFITHNLSLASAYADAIYILKQGQAVERAEKSSAGFSMQSAYGRQLFKAGLVGVQPKTCIEIGT